MKRQFDHLPRSFHMPAALREDATFGVASDVNS